MEHDAVERARQRLAALRSGQLDQADVDVLLARTREQLESLAQVAAELEATLPDRISHALRDSLEAEVLPVGRHIAELRGLSAQTIRRLERLQGTIEAEHHARVEDLALLVDLIASGWRSVEHRLDRLERIIDRLERSLEERAPTRSILRLEDRRGLGPGA